MNKLRLAWAITGSRHYIEEYQDFLPTLDNVDLTVLALIQMHGMETTGKCQ